MNFMGMGIPELGVIFLVAFLVLGPGKAIDTARNVGKVLGDLRRSFGDVTNAMTVETMEQNARSAPTQEQKPDPAIEQSPGVPMRAEIPSDDETDGSDEPSAESDAEFQDSAETGEKG
ncbi:MAG: hypothetical protein CL902_05905 [Dehalococcoidia bacterium]|nr:hypothetical protein [Dehalococcoidia bacterium]|tara:strand:+ start:665 stop:1018 length:354 start_codon:yes stop_codon:yes gene_type:complete